MLLAAASAQNSLNHDFGQYLHQCLDEALHSSDMTFEKRWKKQEEENKKLAERVDRLERITKQLVTTMVQERGGSAEEVSISFPLHYSCLSDITHQVTAMLQNLGI